MVTSAPLRCPKSNCSHHVHAWPHTRQVTLSPSTSSAPSVQPSSSPKPYRITTSHQLDAALALEYSETYHETPLQVFPARCPGRIRPRPVSADRLLNLCKTTGLTARPPPKSVSSLLTTVVTSTAAFTDAQGKPLSADRNTHIKLPRFARPAQ
jgi:hypothetical protein